MDYDINEIMKVVIKDFLYKFATGAACSIRATDLRPYSPDYDGFSFYTPYRVGIADFRGIQPGMFLI